MQDDKDKYQQIIRILKTTPPVPENPEQLTADIIENIRSLPRRRKTGGIWLISGWVSGIAAVILLCLAVAGWKTHAAPWQPADKIPEIPAVAISAETIRQKQAIREQRSALYKYISSYTKKTIKNEYHENK